jgi:hypothetical protein
MKFLKSVVRLKMTEVTDRDQRQFGYLFICMKPGKSRIGKAFDRLEA